VPEDVSALACHEAFDEDADAAPKSVEVARSVGTQERLALGECEINRVQIGAVSGQTEQLSTRSFDAI
jgi:hypothetical protein